MNHQDVQWLNQQVSDITPIILASTSPRRKELLQQLGLKFVVIPSHLVEDDVPGTYRQKAQTLAFQKAMNVAQRHQGLIIGADTMVILNEEILGKPKNQSEAKSMLSKLSGKTHAVITGLAIINTFNQQHMIDSVETMVTFRSIKDDEITAYLATGEPMDKAGAYGIQGLGGQFVAGLKGCYTNVVGLPVSSCLNLLKQVAESYFSPKSNQGIPEPEGSLKISCREQHEIQSVSTNSEKK